ncbi:MAG: pentapeptide repeat-containing protein [Thermoleophilia bacterium]|nr:pentapeptide repeat-containing protein [Thermoleophilia bacterium]
MHQDRLRGAIRDRQLILVRLGRQPEVFRHGGGLRVPGRTVRRFRPRPPVARRPPPRRRPRPSHARQPRCPGHRNFEGVDLTRANLRDANLTRADLRGAMLGVADLTGATFSNTSCPNGTLTNTVC